jgi:hypothetical protein
MSTPAEQDAASSSTAEHPLEPADVTYLFPPDPALIVSPEGDVRGLKEVKDEARAEVAH